MDLAARKIMVTELAKFYLFKRGVDVTSEALYYQLCKLQDEWLDKAINPQRKSEMLEAIRASIHDQLNLLENA